ncbi:Cryptochrome 2, partial [Operophtera brumata]
KGLRLHDNPSLREGLDNAATFRCVFLIDPWFASFSNVGIHKWRFLLQCLQDLDASLRKLNSRLFVIRGQPADALPKLFKEWGTTSLTFEEDPEPYGRVRDHNIMTKCREAGIKVISRVSHTLYKLDKIIERNGGKAPLTYHQFQALIASMPAPPPAEPAVCAESLNGAATPLDLNHDERFGVPTLEELGFDTEHLQAPVWIGGESEALARLERHLERKAFGCLSTRLFYYQLTELYKRVKRVRPPLSLHGQILWREFFYCAATRNPNFDRSNRFPMDRRHHDPAETGRLDPSPREARGGVLPHQRRPVFDELLLDADWSVNAGMWMWLSCSSFFQQFFHCYCPVRFGRKTDPNGDFIRRYIPALVNMPTRYIHEPWVAPESVQESAKCIIGRDYPMPIVDHAKASQVNIERIKQVYAQLANPTSIIASINQSSYLCSASPAPPPAPYNDADLFQRPMKLAPPHRGDRHPKCKEIVIVHKVHKSSVALANPANPQKTFVANGKIDSSFKHRSLPHGRQENCQFKNLAINNFVNGYSSQNVYPGATPNYQPNPNSEYQQVMKINNYNFEQTKFYVPVYPQNVAPRPAHTAVPFIPDPIDGKRERKKEGTKDKSNMNADRSYKI